MPLADRLAGAPTGVATWSTVLALAAAWSGACGSEGRQLGVDAGASADGGADASAGGADGPTADAGEDVSAADADGPAVDLAPPTPERACADFAAAFCERANTCTKGFYVKTMWGDVATCLDRMKDSCFDALNVKGSSWSPQGLVDGASATAAQSCHDRQAGRPPPVCEAMSGSLSDGAPCVYQGQCASRYCAVPRNAFCGTCRPFTKPGDPCDKVRCGIGQACRWASQPSPGDICVETVPEGGACDGLRPCRGQLLCVGAMGDTPGICKLGIDEIGQACDPVSAPCARSVGLVCDENTSTCKPLGIVAAGMPCGNLATGEVVCSSGASCGPMAPGQTVVTCVPPAADGAACNDDKGIRCLSAAACVTPAPEIRDGTCRLPGAITCGA